MSTAEQTSSGDGILALEDHVEPIVPITTTMEETHLVEATKSLLDAPPKNNATSKTRLTDLSEDELNRIVVLLEKKENMALGTTCKYMYEQCNKNVHWKRILLSERERRAMNQLITAAKKFNIFLSRPVHEKKQAEEDERRGIFYRRQYIAFKREALKQTVEREVEDDRYKRSTQIKERTMEKLCPIFGVITIILILFALFVTSILAPLWFDSTIPNNAFPWWYE